ncbi:hypothetical protein Hanom_Chr07g00674641 [Helianthus anomalus]
MEWILPMILWWSGGKDLGHVSGLRFDPHLHQKVRHWGYSQPKDGKDSGSSMRKPVFSITAHLL